jgi:hypothetical protein
VEDDLRKIGVTCWRIKDRKEKNMLRAKVLQEL